MLGLFEEMRECELKPNVISFNAGLSACEKGGEWQKAGLKIRWSCGSVNALKGILKGLRDHLEGLVRPPYLQAC